MSYGPWAVGGKNAIAHSYTNFKGVIKMMSGIFKTILGKQTKEEYEQEHAQLIEMHPEKDVETEVFVKLKEQFSLPEEAKLRQATSGQDTPFEFLTHGNQSFSVWYRLPVKGISGGVHVFDYALFRGTHRITMRESPDIIIECRQLSEGKSNRLDPRAVKDVIGLCLDTAPGMCILVTNRELSEYAKTLAEKFGISVLNMSHEHAGRELLELITSDRQITRERLKYNMERTAGKIETLYVRHQRTPWTTSPMQIASEQLGNNIVRELVSGPKMVSELANAVHTHEDRILNALYGLEKEGKARVTQRSYTSDKENVWALTKEASSSR